MTDGQCVPGRGTKRARVARCGMGTSCADSERHWTGPLTTSSRRYGDSFPEEAGGLGRRRRAEVDQ